MNSSFRKLRFS